MSSINSTKPSCWAASRFLSDSGRPRIASITKKKRCPPSSIGTGSRLSTARFTLMKAVKIASGPSPSLAWRPASVAIWIGPPMIDSSNIGGPIQIATEAGRQAKEGLGPLAIFTAFISVNLAVLNLLPVPMLDGGHLFFFLIEAVLGRPLSLKKREAAQQLGFVLLMLLMVYALWNDLNRLGWFKSFFGG